MCDTSLQHVMHTFVVLLLLLASNLGDVKCNSCPNLHENSLHTLELLSFNAERCTILLCLLSLLTCKAVFNGAQSMWCSNHMGLTQQACSHHVTPMHNAYPPDACLSFISLATPDPTLCVGHYLLQSVIHLFFWFSIL